MQDGICAFKVQAIEAGSEGTADGENLLPSPNPQRLYFGGIFQLRMKFDLTCCVPFIHLAMSHQLLAMPTGNKGFQKMCQTARKNRSAKFVHINQVPR